MNEKGTEEKLRKNARRVVGIAALRKIRVLVDGFDAQECKNKKRLVVLLVISILILLWFVSGVINRQPNYQNINTSQFYLKILNIDYGTGSKGRVFTKG